MDGSVKRAWPLPPSKRWDGCSTRNHSTQQCILRYDELEHKVKDQIDYWHLIDENDKDEIDNIFENCMLIDG